MLHLVDIEYASHGDWVSSLEAMQKACEKNMKEKTKTKPLYTRGRRRNSQIDYIFGLKKKKRQLKAAAKFYSFTIFMTSLPGTILEEPPESQDTQT